MAKKLFEGNHKPVLDNEDRFVTAIEGQEAANYTTKEELFEQIQSEIKQLVPTEVSSIAPFDTGTATGGTTLTIVNTGKSYSVNELVNKAIIRTKLSTGDVEVRLISSNTATTISIADYFKPFSDSTVVGDTYKVVDPTVVVDGLRNQIIRVDLSSGYDHVVLHPRVSDANNRNIITTYVEGFSGTAVLYGLTYPSVSGPSGNQTFNGLSNQFELVANRELVSHIFHYAETPHFDMLYSGGLDAFLEAIFPPQSVTGGQAVFAPITTTPTLNLSRRVKVITVSGNKVFRYDSQISRPLKIIVQAEITNNSSPATTLTVGLRYYNAIAGTTTDYTLPGSNEQVNGSGSIKNFTFTKELIMAKDDWVQIIHKNSNSNNYSIVGSIIW